MSLMQTGTNKHWYQQVPRQLPLLFISGKDDPVGQMGKGIPRIVKRLQKNNFASVSMQQYEAMRHEILLEPNHQQVYDDILAWLTHPIN